MGTEVVLTKLFEKQLRKVPNHIRINAIDWIESVERYGIRFMRQFPGYHDEPLKGDRRGQRSIRLSKSYRLIYEEREKEVLIYVLEVSKHGY